MNELKELDLKDVSGGGISIAAGIAIGTIAVFLIGVIDGFVNPEKCK